MKRFFVFFLMLGLIFQPRFLGAAETAVKDAAKKAPAADAVVADEDAADTETTDTEVTDTEAPSTEVADTENGFGGAEDWALEDAEDEDLKLDEEEEATTEGMKAPAAEAPKPAAEKKV